MVLYNNVPPRFTNISGGGSTTIGSSVPQSPTIGTDNQRQHKQQNPFDIFRQLTQTPPAESAFGQLPKRTVSLGPRRPLAAPPTPKVNESLNRNPFVSCQQQQLKQQGGFERERNFNRMAEDLKSSLTELNILIDSVPSTPKIAQKPPKFTSYLTNTPDSQPSYAKHYNSGPTGYANEPTSPPSPERLTDWQIDSMNWKPSGSVTDLRSMFEQPKLSSPSGAPLLPPAPRRPSSSNSPSILRNTPWQTMGSSQQPPSGLANTTRSEQDYTIRRTTSTSSRTSNVRNPYRSYYGNYY